MVVDAPFIGICGAVPMEELMQAIGEADPLGLRERLLLMYERPRFVRSAELREAYDKLPPGDTLRAFLARGFWKLHSPNHPAHRGAQFKQDLNYQWLHYTFDDAAAELFWANFDDHAGQQETNYRLGQQAAKKAGKGKTRHYRLPCPCATLCRKPLASRQKLGISRSAMQLQRPASFSRHTWMRSSFLWACSAANLLRNLPLQTQVWCHRQLQEIAVDVASLPLKCACDQLCSPTLKPSCLMKIVMSF